MSQSKPSSSGKPTLTVPHLPARRKPISRLASLSAPGKRHGGVSSIGMSMPPMTRRASVTGLTSGPKSQRSSKTTHKLVVLPSAPQTRPLPTERNSYGGPPGGPGRNQESEDDLAFQLTSSGLRESNMYKSTAEKMSKDQRKEAGYKRITAYCVAAESFRMGLLAGFLKREHNVAPRVFDEAIYAMYHHPLLPGYGPNTSIRSSAPPKKPKYGGSKLGYLSEAEENGYQGSYFTAEPVRSPTAARDGYISTSPADTRRSGNVLSVVGDDTGSARGSSRTLRRTTLPQRHEQPHEDGNVTGTETVSDLGFMSDPEPTTDVRYTRVQDIEPNLMTPASDTAVLDLSRQPLEAVGENSLIPDTETQELDPDPGAQTDPGVYGRSDWHVKNDMETTTPDIGKNAAEAVRNTELPVLEKEGEKDEGAGEVVFFEYGVVVFFGLSEGQEKDILEDINRAGVVRKSMDEDDWEIEECHFAHDPHISYPRIYNDFFTLKSRSHLLKLSIAHALAQSTLLARYETTAQRVLSSPLTLSIPRQLAEKGALRLRRHDALKLTGRLFKLRRDVNLVSNVLDVPELFWSEASLKELYDAVREYMEIQPRVEVLNEKLGVASDFLDAIHDHLNNNAMDRITWIVIWLIVAAILVELGEILARLVYHSSSKSVAVKLATAAASCQAQLSSLTLPDETTLRTMADKLVTQA
ncbi:hypothetical protein CPB83DRAFT_851313 [Crepidotus variabilis]|uniref:DUF155 domain-containing protein n=1 Tax=Crepidotus variabilis TaxID=179855 RepID=A0A9P6EJN8_9AGAR|nr:hypothetical protein CPB83DRAFT_851313 [Crepidotus variabilis]